MSTSASRCLSVSAMLLTAPLVAMAQTDGGYPNKPVRVVVGFTPGSATDVTARLFAQKFTESFGQTVAIDNIPGAAGTVGCHPRGEGAG